MNILREFFSFIKTGKTGDDKHLKRDFIYLFVIVLLARYSIVIGKALMLGEDITDFSEEMDRLSIGLAVSYILVIPLIEELIFRGFLGLPRRRKSMYFVALGFIAGLAIYLISSQFFYPLLFVVLLLSFAYIRIDSFNSFVDSAITKNYHLLVFISVFIFAGVHVTNYDDYSIATFVALIPRVISGFYLSYIISKYSIWHSWLMHAVNNAIPFLILLMSLV